MELWREDLEGCLSELVNELALLRPPSFMYGAQPSPASLTARARRMGRQLGGADGVRARFWFFRFCFCFNSLGAGVLVCQGRGAAAWGRRRGAVAYAIV